jgi:AraC-like DNA-binding protein
MTLNFFTILTVISMFLTTILTLFFLVTKKGIRKENNILAALLVIFNLQIAYSFWTSDFAFQYFLEWHKAIFLIRQISFLIGPLIYLYVRLFLKKTDVITYRSLIHLIPFIGSVIFLLIFYRYTNHFIIWESDTDLYTTILILASNLLYLVLSLKSIRSMNSGFRALYKNIMSSSQSSWLQILLLGFIVLWIVNLNSFAIIMILRRPGWCAFTASIYALTVFLFLNTLMFLLLVKPDIYYLITKYKSNKLEDCHKKEYLQRLNSYMETYKPYLNPDISLESLSKEISVNPRILSQIINETLNKNFKSYILEYRIKESTKMLEDTNLHKLTILEILYNVGFNSKSAFNNQFKLYTNLTPQEYRAKYVN